MDLAAEIDTVLVVEIEDRLPAPRLLGEAVLDEARRPLRIGIEDRPGERAGEGHMLGQPEAAGHLRRLAHLVRRSMAALLGIAAQLRRALAIEEGVIGRMHGDHLALEMGRELADRDADIGELALDLVAVSLALMGLVEIEEAPVPAGDLDRLVAIALGPARDAFERVVRGCVLRELGKKQPWPFHRPHAASSLRVQDPRWFEQGSAGARF